MGRTNWLWVSAGAIALTTIPATLGLDTEIAGPVGAALILHGFGCI